MSAPRTKRQFAGAASDPAQRQITSFFNSASPTSLSSSQHLGIPPTSYASPPLPATVQSNLLSVGMRVRKSVPEGYKTGSYSAFALWDENANADINTNTGLKANNTMGEGRSRANAISTPRELLPFCGIHKVGGLGTQPEDDSSAPPRHPLLSVNGHLLDDAMTDDDDVPGLTSSQDSLDSAPPATPGRTRKRSYTEDEEPSEAPSTPGRLSVASFDFNVWRDGFDGEVSPRSHIPAAPAGWLPSPTKNARNGRVMAVPRKTKFRSVGGKPATRGQENVMVFGEGDADGTDFGEADFLVRTAEEWEVEMSDV